VTTGISSHDHETNSTAKTTGADIGLIHPIAPAAGRHCSQTIRHVENFVSNSPMLAAGPLTRRELGWAGQQCSPGMLSQLDARRGVVLDVGDTPQPVRRALIFIDEHAGDPITLNEIALAARLSPRGLQAAFRRHLDTTPLAYLHSVRMERAHRDLQSADPDDNMSMATSVARLRIDPSWRFAIAYRRRFGSSPSQTLRS
jgi:AraC-like DNA-binding protein